MMGPLPRKSILLLPTNMFENNVTLTVLRKGLNYTRSTYDEKESSYYGSFTGLIALFTNLNVKLN